MSMIISTPARAKWQREVAAANGSGPAGEAAHGATSNVAVKRGPIGDVAITPDGRTLVLANFGEPSVSFFDTGSASVTATVPVNGEPVAVAAGAHRAFVAYSNRSFDAISVIDIDTKETIADHRLADTARALDVSADGRRLYVGRVGPEGADVAIVDVETGEVRVVDIAPYGAESIDALRAAADGRRLYVATSTTYEGSVAVVDIRRGRVEKRLPLAAPVRDIALTADGRVACVLTCHPIDGGAVYMLDSRADGPDAPMVLGGFPSQLALSRDGNRAYIVDRDCVDVMDTRNAEILDTIQDVGHPSCVAIHPDGIRLYIADCAGSLAVRAMQPGRAELPAPAPVHHLDKLLRREFEPVAV